MQKISWHQLEISSDQTHHLVDKIPAYDARFLSVLKFHEPGLAPVLDALGAYHIDVEGRAAYPNRFIRVFGFYEGLAAVQAKDGWYHILPDGSECYQERFLWCGNFQQSHCCVKDFNERFFHIDREGKRTYPRSYKYVGDFRDGYAAVQDETGLYFHIDFKGNPLHEKKFLDLDVFHKGFARARDSEGWFHINSQGFGAYSHRFKAIEPFYNGIARVETKEGAIYLIKEDGEITTVLRKAIQNEFHQVSAELVSYWKYYTLDAACALKLFDYLPNTTQGISEKISIPQRSTEKLLRALAEMGFIQKSDQSLWILAPKGDFLTTKHPFSLLKAQELWKAEHLESWRHLLFSLKTHTPAFNQLFGESWFDYLKNKKEKTHLYHQVLSIYAKQDYSMFVSRIDFGLHRSVVDIGGSSGALMFELLNANPHLRGMILDLPNVIELIQIPSNLKDRLDLITADFFDQWPSFKADSAILSRVLHDWSDESCAEILKKARKILSDGPHSRLYIIENILKEKSCSGSLLDLNMLVMTEGQERTLEGFKRNLIEAGFALDSLCPLNEVSTIMIARKSYE